MADITNSLKLSKKVHELIPAAAHTYSKGDDQFPSNAPRFIDHGKGSHVWDIDGNEYIDYGMGLRSVILGHGYEKVVEAAKKYLAFGSNFTRPHPIEYEFASLLNQLIPSAEMVKLAKNGSDATTAAIRLARAYTKRDKIAFCKDHPFFSVNDWFIGTTAVDAGIPKVIKDLSLPFRYNNIESVKILFEEHGDDLACLIMEATVAPKPEDSFLQKIRDITKKYGTVFILDEIITGFRYHINGAQKYFNVKPDLSTFGKAIGNGFAVSALAGRKDIMELGGLRHKAERVFLLSTTHGGEVHSLAAAKATVEEIKDKNVPEHLFSYGKKLREGINHLSKEKDILQNIFVYGYDCSPVIAFKINDEFSFPLKTLFQQEMIEQGILYPGYIALSYSHTEKELEKTLAAAEKAIEVCKSAIQSGNIGKFLNGEITKPVFRKYN